jgi:hypothetical protein
MSTNTGAVQPERTVDLAQMDLTVRTILNYGWIQRK